jgi:hypothetical protein
LNLAGIAALGQHEMHRGEQQDSKRHLKDEHTAPAECGD